jgi:hypothetical protein
MSRSPHRARLRRALAVQDVADHLGQHPQRPEDADQRRLPPDLQQIDVEQRP